MSTCNHGVPTCSINHVTVQQEKTQVPGNVAAYITNLIKISLPDGKGLVGM
jgi:hypothetical protein